MKENKEDELGQLTVTTEIHEPVRLLARAWRISEGAVVERLLTEFRSGEDHGAEHAPAVGQVPIHTVYEGERVRAAYDPGTHRVTILSGPLAGKSWKSPSGAAVAVVRQIKPAVRAERNGWSFWTVTATGHALQSLR
jgi:hypothetical protein